MLGDEFDAFFEIPPETGVIELLCQGAEELLCVPRRDSDAWCAGTPSISRDELRELQG
jgi:hypothetical protein